MYPGQTSIQASLALDAYDCAQQQSVVQEGGSWQEVLRALCALEAVISQGSSAACGEIAVHFQVSAQQARRAHVAKHAVGSVSMLKAEWEGTQPSKASIDTCPTTYWALAES